MAVLAAGQVSRPWETMPCTLDSGPAAAGAIGLIVLGNDVVIESELRTFLKVEGMSIYSNRIPLEAEINPTVLRRMKGRIPQAAGLIVPDDRLDVIAFGCTSGTMAIGAENVAAAVHKTRPGMPVTDPISASLKALKTVGAQRIALLTPYPDSVNEVVAEYFGKQDGVEVCDRGSFKQLGDPTISRIPPDAIYAAGVDLGRRNVDALFISCTALRCSSAIERIERAVGKPVIASNQALAWDAARMCGYREPIRGFGQLLTL